MSDLRAELFGRIDGIAALLEADVAEGETLGYLPGSTVEALHKTGLMALKTPRELGGFEAEPPLQYEVFERVAHHSIAAAWCLFIHADTAGMIGSRLGLAGIDRMLVDGRMPICCGGGGLRPGTVEAVDGGVLLSGNFRYGSGIHGADWVMVSGVLAAPDGGRPQVLTCVLPRTDVTVHRTWQVHGLRATGSDDFSAEAVFVPTEMTFPAGSPPLRGGRQYRTGLVGFLAYTVPAVTGAVARRCLDELVGDADTRTRGYTRPSTLAQRALFQSFVGETDMRLRAARALMLADAQDLMDQVDQPGVNVKALDARARASAAYATRVASDVLHDMARFAGGDALRQGSSLEKGLRDVTMAATHLLMNEVAYENHAQFLMGIPGADPMA